MKATQKDEGLRPMIAVPVSSTLAGCGSCGSTGTGSAVPAAMEPWPQALRVRHTLLDDEGRAHACDPSGLPADTQAQAQAGRYAAAGRAALVAAVGARAITGVSVGCCGAAVESGAQALARQPDAAALLVGGEPHERAVAAADRLEAVAPGRVWRAKP